MATTKTSAAAVTPARGAGVSKRFDLARPSRQHILGYLLLTPAVLMVLLIIAYPLIISIDLSLQDVKLPRIGETRKPFTFKNYERLFTSGEFWMACWITVKLVATVTVGALLVGVSTALLVNQRFPGRALARIAMALPWAVPEVIAVVIFAWIFDSSFGLMSWLLIKLGFADQMVAWVSTPSAAFWALSLTMIWKGFPFVSIMTLAGLQSIPEDFYAAARVDGASALQRFRWITLPSLMPVLGVTVVLVMLWVFRDFSIIKVLTGGGPLKTTQTLSIMTYDQAFGFFKFGYASAVGVVTLVICVVASLAMLGRQSKAIY
ncbi:MAG: carbohydrate ABC transporter permease [Geminicoccaceae bacterium]